jgi:hypothetical protein
MFKIGINSTSQFEDISQLRASVNRQYDELAQYINSMKVRSLSSLKLEIIQLFNKMKTED